MKSALQKCAYAAAVAAISAAFVLGGVATGFAKEKKKPEEPKAQPITCWFEPSVPVCADKGGERLTYASACRAEKDGAKVVSSKACPEKKVQHTEVKPAKKDKKSKKNM
jgi:hypothetical protein